jgi:phage FluMu gp28-like protein
VELTQTLTFLIEYLNLPEAVGDPDANWETFQLKHLNNPSLFAIELKSRQVGWSWLTAAEAVASAIIYPRTPHIFVSINQDEAAEKIRYAKAVIESLDRDVRPRLVKDNSEELEFPNGSRLISHPCRPPRGKPRARIYLDEFAHYPNDREIYTAAVPAISKGGMIRIGSSPLGARGRFWEIFTESMGPYPGYVRESIPWWHIQALCKDVRRATQEAPSLPTEDRVAEFGTPRLVTIFQNMPLDDFQQEYECAWLDETVAWIDWDLIKRNQVLAGEEKLKHWRAKNVGQALALIDDVKRATVEGRIEEVLVGGMDIGRHKDTTEIVLLSKNTYANTLPWRYHITLDRIEFDDQLAVVNKLLDRLPITAFLIDTNGIGMQLAENAARHPAAQAFKFTNDSKNLLANETKLRAQRAEVPLPLDRDVSYQIHSIRKKVTAANNAVFDVDANEKHHADIYWAWALAVWAGKQDGQTNAVMPSVLSNYRG